MKNITHRTNSIFNNYKFHRDNNISVYKHGSALFKYGRGENVDDCTKNCQRADTDKAR